MPKPEIIKGGIAIDDRGELQYINEFEKPIKRFYVVKNHKSHFVRAWHGHKLEEKFVFVVKGCALIKAVHVTNWGEPVRNVKVHEFVLSEKSPQILHIPAGYANGFMNLVNDTKIVFFSTATLEESKKDDYRYDWQHFGKEVWKVKNR